jgi:ubiquinone/menaquinone biosynthesis C-methylase UbiE
MSGDKATNDYPAKRSWQSPERAAKYRDARSPKKFRRYHLEKQFLTGWLSDLPPGAVVLDCPCGAGRWVPTLKERGVRYLGADFSRHMIHQAQAAGAGSKLILGFINADAERLPLADNSVDCVILWRLLHHIRDERTRQNMLQEAARVSRYKVLVSFHHPISFTFLRKFIQHAISGRHGQSITHWRLRREAQACGLEMTATAGIRKYVSINWFACLTKKRAAAAGKS